jgi:hypothetical protein
VPHDAIAAARVREPVTTEVPPMTARPPIDPAALRAALARRIALRTGSRNPGRAASGRSARGLTQVNRRRPAENSRYTLQLAAACRRAKNDFAGRRHQPMQRPQRTR